MRKIERAMLDAITARRDFYQANTAVVFSDHNGNPYLDATVYLHGNAIAEVLPCGKIEPNTSMLTAWPTPTTCSRLRALGIGAHIKNGQPHIDNKPV